MSYPQPLIFKRHPFFNPPPLGRVYLVGLYFILILILLFHDSIVSGPMYYETIAYRAAWVSVCQVTLIFLLAMKNSIIGFLIGSSHERLNWLHRTVARFLLFTVTIHFGFFWREWWIYSAIKSELATMTMVKFGLGAWFVLIWIAFSSFAPIRNVRYEVFVVQHVISFIALITCIMLHVPDYAKVYVWLPIGFYAFDRSLRTLRLVYRNLGIFHRRTRKNLFSCKAQLTALPGHATRITIQNPPVRSWSPGQHVFISIPSISPFQSHPFTIASSPSSATKELSFVVRAHAGFSRRLYNCATSLLPTTSHPAKERPFTIFLDGPYGCPPNFLQYDTLVLIAGSTGVTFTIPILLHALESPSASCVRRIQFTWIVKAGSHFEWFANEISHALYLADQRGIDLDIRTYVTCDPTYTTNFPVRNPPSRPSKKPCCCTRFIDESSLSTAKGSEAESISLSSTPSEDSDCETKGMCTCNCSSGAERSPVLVEIGRPDLRTILERNLMLARGETGVAVCGPEGLMARTRCLVAALSDERGAEKGTGAFGVELFGEGFGW